MKKFKDVIAKETDPSHHTPLVDAFLDATPDEKVRKEIQAAIKKYNPSEAQIGKALRAVK